MRKRIIIISAVAVASLGLAGCTSTPTTPGSTESATPVASGTGVTIVASTNVYADIAATIGGDHVEVLTVIESSAADPHSYEATPRDRLTVQKADLIIENGGGYDSFMEQLREGVSAPVITAFAELGEDVEWEDRPGHDDADHDDSEHDHADHDDAADEHEHDHADESEDDVIHSEEDDHGHEGHDHSVNEHVWYDIEIMQHVAEHVKDELSTLDAANAADYQKAYEAFVADIAALNAEMEQLEKDNGHVHVFATEPISGYLLDDLDLHDVAPEGFASAVEEGNDVAPAVRLDARKLIESGEVQLVVSNVQTGGAETDEIEQLAAAKNIPVVKLSELLPEGKSYVEWMRENVKEIASALSSR